MDHAWDIYTNFCNAYDGGSSSMAPLVATACRAAQKHVPSFASQKEVEQQLQVQQEENSMLRTQLCNVESALGGQSSKAQELQDRLKIAEEECKELKAGERKEARLLDELWKLFKSYKQGMGHNSTYNISYYAGAIPKELQERLPDLK